MRGGEGCDLVLYWVKLMKNLPHLVLGQIDENPLGGTTGPHARTEMFRVKGSKRCVERGARETCRWGILVAARSVHGAGKR